MPATQIQLRRDTGANWTSEDPILAEGEIGIETNASPVKFKIGDGSTAWTSLDYFEGDFDLAAGIHAADEKATIHDDDEIGGSDSEASYGLKKWLWGTVKAWITAFANLLYARVSPTFYDDVTNGQLMRWNSDDGWNEPFTLAAYGDVNGPAGAVEGNIATFVGTTGKQIGDSSFSPDDFTPINGWIPDPDTWTRTGNYTYTKSGDHTVTHRKGAKIRYKDGGAFEYGVIGSSSHVAGTTTINLIPNSDWSMASATITDRYISYIENPEGFPPYFNITIDYTGFSTKPTTLVSKWRATPSAINYVYIQNTLGTSDQNYFTITGLPIAIATALTLYPTIAFGADNSSNLKEDVANTPLPLRIDISGTTISLGRHGDSLTTWTPSGTKGVYALDLTYPY